MINGRKYEASIIIKIDPPTIDSDQVANLDAPDSYSFMALSNFWQA